MIVSGVISGIAAQSYQAAQAFPGIVTIFFCFTIVFSRMRKIVLQNLIVYLIACSIGMGPSILFIAKNFSAFMGRNKTINVFVGAGYEHTASSYKTRDKIDILKIQLKHILGSFHYYKDTSIKFGIRRPLLDPLLGVLLILGLGILLMYIHSPPFYFLGMWSIVILLGGGILTTNSPFFPRYFGVLPPLFIIMSLVPASIYGILKSKKWLSWFFIPEAFLVTLLSILAFYNIKLYFRDFVHSKPMDTVTTVARYIKDTGKDYHYYLLTIPQFGIGHNGLSFINGDGIRKTDLPDPSRFFCSRLLSEKSVFIIIPQTMEYLPFVRDLFPDSVYTEFGNPQYPTFYTILVDKFQPLDLDHCIDRVSYVKSMDRWILKESTKALGISYIHGRILC